MLPLRDITMWSAHARWATEAQVEQDLLITRAMVAIFRDEFLASQVAMRGGTVLHKVHLAPAARYSEDIDLVAVGNRPRGHIVRALKRVLNPVLGHPTRSVVERVRLAVRNAVQPNEVARLTYEYAPSVPPPALFALKVEVNVTERTSLLPIVPLRFMPPLPEGTPDVAIMSYHLDEMLATKLRALLQREHGRDLFDLARAWDVCSAVGASHSINGVQVATAFSRYMAAEGSDVTRSYFEARLSQKLGLARFRADLRDVLALGTPYDVDEAADCVRAHFLSHLP